MLPNDTTVAVAPIQVREFYVTVTGKIKRRRKPLRWEWLLYILLFAAIVVGAFLLYGKQWTLHIDKTVEVSFVAVDNPAFRGTYVLHIDTAVNQALMLGSPRAEGYGFGSADETQPFSSAARKYFSHYYAVKTSNTEQLSYFVRDDENDAGYDVTMRVVEDNSRLADGSDASIRFEGLDANGDPAEINDFEPDLH